MVQLFKDAFREWRKDNPSFIAAGLSYFTLFSLVPILIIIVSIVAKIFSKPTASHHIYPLLEIMVSPEAARAIEVLMAATGRAAAKATFLSFLIFFWGASRLFAHLQTALNIVWSKSHEPRAGFRRLVWKRVESVLMVAFLGGVVVVFFLLDIAFGASRGFLREYLPKSVLSLLLLAWRYGFSLALFTVIFSFIYKMLPDIRVRWKDVLGGALVSSIFLAVGRSLISLYFKYSRIATLYGAAGSLVVILIWVYFSMLIFLFGAEFAWVYSHRRGSLQKGIVRS